MTNDREQVLQQALSLPVEDRVYVVTALEESLLAPDQVAATSELLSELRRRSQAYRSGTTTARFASEFLADQRRSQAGETKA